MDWICGHCFHIGEMLSPYPSLRPRYPRFSFGSSSISHVLFRCSFACAAFLFDGATSISADTPAANAKDLPKLFASPPRSYAPKQWWRWQDRWWDDFSVPEWRAGLEFKPDIPLFQRQLASFSSGGMQGVMWGVYWPGPKQTYEWFGPTTRECVKLGLTLDIHSEPGQYGGSGGAWIEPDQSMQFLTWSLTRLEGGDKEQSVELPVPPRNGFKAQAGSTEHYRDVKVIAFPDPDPVVLNSAPRVTGAGLTDKELKTLTDGDHTTRVANAIQEGKSIAIDFAFESAQRMRAFSLQLDGPISGEVFFSQDGATYEKARSFNRSNFSLQEGKSASLCPLFVPFVAPSAKHFKIVLRRYREAVALREVGLVAGARVDRLPEQAIYSASYEVASHSQLGRDEALSVDPDRIVDLTDRMDDKGRLTWTVPMGRWVVMRLGRTTTAMTDGLRIPEGFHGLESDKLSREAQDIHYKHWLDPLLEVAGPEGRKAVGAVWTDSWEIYVQNWTPAMPREFQGRNGYPLDTFLPAFAGYLVRDRDETEKFFWDWRRTLADLVADNFYGRTREIAHARGLKYEAQVYGNAYADMWDPIQAGGRVDVVQNEIWTATERKDARVRGIPSAGHIYGPGRLVGGEHLSQWMHKNGWFPGQTPAEMKPAADYHFCLGVNQMTFATFNPHHSDPDWVRYISRCQVLLREGYLRADICYLYGEGAPLRPNTRMVEAPAGYRLEFCSAELLLDPETRVRDGKLVLRGGMEFKVLLLPPDDSMTLPMLRRVEEFLNQGLVVAGMRPDRAPSRRIAGADDAVRALADKLWGTSGEKVRTVGKGRLYAVYDRAELRTQQDEVLTSSRSTRVLKPDLSTVLNAEKIAPDFSGPESVCYIHRWLPEQGLDIYFLSHQGRAATLPVSFRVTGKKAQLWSPESGEITPAPSAQKEGGRTTLQLPFALNGSVFVVFGPN